MRILHVPQAYKTITGGGERHVETIARLSAARGHDVHVIASDIDLALRKPRKGWRLAGAAREELVEGVHLHRSECRTRTGALLRLPVKRIRSLRKSLEKRHRREIRATFEAWVAERMRTLAPDVVVVQAHLRPSVHAAFRAVRNHPVPVVYIPLVHIEEAFTWQPDMRTYAREADACITLSDTERDFLHQEWGIPEDRIVAGHLGTDLPNEGPVEALGDHVLVLGRLDPNKRMDLVLAAMEHVWARHPSTRLVFAGATWDGNQAIKALLSTCTPELRARIDVHTDISAGEKARLVRSARCLAFASRYESFGFVILEAWSHGVPVVVWDTPLFREIVAEGTGWHARSHSPRDFGRCLDAALGDEPEARRRGRAGHERLRARYAWGDVLPRYEAAYAIAQRVHAARRG